MMKFKLEAQNPTGPEELIVTERAWRPVRSLMAIANHSMIKSNGFAITEFEDLENLDVSVGNGLDAEICTKLAEEMERLLQDPFAIVDYGMTIDIKDGEEAYTYPTNMCTAYFEDVDTGDFYASLDDSDIVPNQTRIRSWFRATTEEMQEVIDFLKSCGGFMMP